MQILITGGSGVLGRATVPLLRGDGHEVRAPSRGDLDLFEPAAVAEAVRGASAVYHLATRIPPPERRAHPAAWAENDRLRSGATRVLVDAALAAAVRVVVLPTVAFIYPPGVAADEDTPPGDVPRHLRSALAAEEQVLRFAAAGRVGVVLRLGLLYGPGTGTERPADGPPTIHLGDAGRALAAALDVPSGIYNVVDDGGMVANARFTRAAGWRPEASAPARPEPE